MKWLREFLKKLVTREEKFGSNLTPRAQEVFAIARTEADRLHHNYIGTEHVLLGLIALGKGVAVNVLSPLGLNLENVRAEVEKLTGTGPDNNSAVRAPYTPRVKKVLAFAREEARTLHHAYIGTEHLLLGLLREGNGMAAIALRNLGADLYRIRIEVLKEVDPHIIPTDEVHQNMPKFDEPASKDWFESAEEALQEWKSGPNFTPRAKRALILAGEEAKQLHHNFVGAEHILLGLIKLDVGVAAKLLGNLGLNLEKARVEVEKLAGIRTDEKISGRIPYTPRAKRILGEAKKEAELLHHTFIGTEHILLGLLSETGGLAAEVFKNFKVDVEQLRKKIYDELKPPGDSSKV